MTGCLLAYCVGWHGCGCLLPAYRALVRPSTSLGVGLTGMLCDQSGQEGGHIPQCPRFGFFARLREVSVGDSEMRHPKKEISRGGGSKNGSSCECVWGPGKVDINGKE